MIHIAKKRKQSKKEKPDYPTMPWTVRIGLGIFLYIVVYHIYDLLAYNIQTLCDETAAECPIEFLEDNLLLIMISNICITTSIALYIIHMMRKGYLWAVNTCFVIFIAFFSLYFFIMVDVFTSGEFSIFDILNPIAVIIAFILLYLQESLRWFKGMKQARIAAKKARKK